MGEARRKPSMRVGTVKDARGRSVAQFDPVKAFLLNQSTVIPTETLQVIVNGVLPGARRQRLIQVLSVAFGFLFVVGGTVIYFRYFSTWKGLDLVNTTIYAVQLAVLISGPVIAFRMARSEYAGRVVAAMLKQLRCPHCGYDLRRLPIDPTDGATVCPECGCAWLLGSAQAVVDAGERHLGQDA